jgi:hypothetical protein
MANRKGNGRSLIWSTISAFDWNWKTKPLRTSVSPERDFKVGPYEYEATHNTSLVYQYFTNPSRQISVVKWKLLWENWEILRIPRDEIIDALLK